MPHNSSALIFDVRSDERLSVALAFIFTVFLFLVLTLKGLALDPWFFLLAAVIGIGLILSSHSANNVLSVGTCRLASTGDMQR